MNLLLATHGKPELLEQTLASILQRENAPFFRRIVIVENGGDCGARAVVRRFEFPGLIEFISVPHANKSRALNAGLTVCTDGLIFMTDDDVIVEAGVGKAYHAAARDAGEGRFFGGPIRTLHESKPMPWLTPFLPLSARGLSGSDSAVGGRSRFLGANWAAYRQDLLAVGGFNTNFGPGSTTGATGQEKEMQLRLQARGLRGVWVEGAIVTHFVPKTRCTPEWIVNRAYRTAVQQGILDRLENADRAADTMARLKRRERIRRLGVVLLPGKQRRFRHAYWKSWAAGYNRGVELAAGGRLAAPPTNALDSSNLAVTAQSIATASQTTHS